MENRMWRVLCLVMLCGAMLRVGIYIKNRSLWLDEAATAKTILERPIGELHRPMALSQLAPVGWLYVTKVVTHFAGGGEKALRFVALVGGLACIPLFYLFCKSVALGTLGTLFAMTLFCFNAKLVYYSGEVKSYILDVVFALLLYLVAIPLLKGKADHWKWLKFSVVASVAIWFSFGIVFVLAGIAAGLIYESRKKKASVSTQDVIVGFVLPLFSALTFFFLCMFRNGNIAGEHSKSYWDPHFLPLGRETFSWLAKNSTDLLYQLGFRDMAALILCLAIAGAVLHFRKRAALVYFMALPLALAVLASALKIYPITARLMLFLLPAVIVWTAMALEQFKATTSLKVPFAAIFVIFIGFKLAEGTWADRAAVREEMRPVLQKIAATMQPSDVFYVYASGSAGFDYYRNILSTTDDKIVHGRRFRENPSNYLQEIDQLRGQPRVWFVFGHLQRAEKAAEYPIMRSYLEHVGTRLASVEAAGVAAHLYDLARPKPTSERQVTSDP